jgi:hypothetical protein
MKSKRMAVGFGWYRRREWQRLLEVSEDRMNIRRQYDDWMVEVENVYAKVTESSQTVVRIDVQVQELLDWTFLQGLRVNGESRSRYALYRVEKMYGGLSDTQAVLDRLKFTDGSFPRAAMEAAIEKREEITPELIRILEFTKQNYRDLFDLPDYWGYYYALYLVAQFREPAAYEPIVDLFSVPGEAVVDLTEDFVTQDLGRVLASVCNGDTTPIENLVMNSRASIWVRTAALSAFLVLLFEGERSREWTINYFRSLFQRRVIRKNALMLGCLIAVCADLKPGELMPEIREAFGKGLVDEGMIELETVENILNEDEETTRNVLARFTYIRDSIQEMERFFPPAEPAEELLDFEPPLLPATPQLSGIKIGRNDSCPCGSGKKYKKCCGR